MLRWALALALFPILICLHLYVAPYTKVEESFNVQAVHDILTYGIPTEDVGNSLRAQYDHMTFPGAVPRTFIGAVVLAGVSKLVLWLTTARDRQQLVRAVLGLLNAASLIAYALSVRKAFGRTAGLWYIALQASQFHVLFYASRTLPNMFAFGICTFALSLLLPDPSLASGAQVKRIRLATYLLTLATVIFRSELVLLLASHSAYLLFTTAGSSVQSQISFIRKALLPAGIFGVLIGLIITIPIDTFFLQSPRPLWPELSAFLSNVFPSDPEHGASAWGTSAWHWYFTSALPRVLLNPLIFLLNPYSLTQPGTRSAAAALLIPNVSYIILYSILPHKETRFLFPVLPPLTATAAIAATNISNRRNRTTFYRLATYTLVASTAITFLISHAVMLPLSALSYPGAQALNAVHKYAAANNFDFSTRNTILIHIDNLALQTGVTRFLQLPPPVKDLARKDWVDTSTSSGGAKWIYDKSDNATDLLNPFWWEQFDYTIMERPALAIGPWEVVEVIYGIGKVRVLRPDEEKGPANAWKGMGGVLREMYGWRAGKVSGMFREVVRERLGLTGGWWVDLGMVKKLYVLRRGKTVLDFSE